MKNIKKLRCDFCNKIIDKENYKLKDKYRSYYICRNCNNRAKEFEKEYNILHNRITEEYKKQLENMAMKLRKKYKLIAKK